MIAAAYLAILLLPGAVTPTAAPVASPRQAYNRALVALDARDLDAAEKGFLDARDRAGIDDELRFRAAFDLGCAYAAQAETLEKEKPEDALAALRSAAAWLRDAVRERPQEADPRANLEVVLKRAQALSDKLNKRAGTLEARLDRLIEDERSLRDDARSLLERVTRSGAASDPAAFHDAFRAAAAFQRTLLGEAGALVSLAADDAAHLESAPKEQQKAEDRLRAAQLRALVTHLEDARQRMADARALLGKLQAEAAHRATDAALRSLARGREQLRDPIAVLQACLGDEVSVAAEAQALAPRTSIGKDLPPAWLTGSYEADRQDDVRARVDELVRRLRAAVTTETAQPGDPEVARLIEATREALPHMADALRAMIDAKDALQRNDGAIGASSAISACEALSRAIERYAGLRELIELSYAEARAIVDLLDPTATATPTGTAEPASPPLTTEARARRIQEATDRDVERLARLEGLIEEEKGNLPTPTASPQPDEKSAAQRDRLRRAETERRAAALALTGLRDDLARDAPARPLLDTARDGLSHIEALRRLFFSIVEHLEELARSQLATRDETAAAAAMTDPAARARAAGPPAEAESRHAATARAISRALAEEAKAARTPTATASGGDAARAGEKLSQAATEVESAARSMDDALGAIRKTAPDLDPALAGEQKALEHLAAAIALLKPPEQQDQKEGEQQKQQQKDGAQGEKKPEPEQHGLSREQAQRRLQSMRDREADRARSGRKRDARAQPDPVDEDW